MDDQPKDPKEIADAIINYIVSDATRSEYLEALMSERDNVIYVDFKKNVIYVDFKKGESE